MTETVWDLYGWGSWEVACHMARRYAWCVKHREQYSGHVTTAGICYWCESCDQENMRRVSDEKGI